MNSSRSENEVGKHFRVSNIALRTAEESGESDSSTLSWRFVLAIAALSLLVRLTYMLVFQTWNFKHEWAFGHEMGRIGEWLAQGKGFSLDGNSPTAKFPPFYPLLVGGIFYVTGAYTRAAAVSLFLLQSICSAAIAVCLARLGNRLLGRTAGIIAGVAWAFYPTSIFYSVVRIWYSELALLLVLIVTMIVVGASHPVRSTRMALLGAASGLTVLTDSTMVLYLAVVVTFTLLARRIPFPRKVGFIVVLGIAAGGVTSPWVIRNLAVFGSPILLKSNFGMELYIGNVGPESTAMKEKFVAVQEREVAFQNGASNLAYYRYLQNIALHHIREHPSEFVWASARRFVQFWIVNPDQGSESWLRLAFFTPLLLLALSGIRYARAREWQVGPLWLFLLSYPVPYYLAHVNHGRYSYPVEPFVLLLAAISVTLWFEQRYAPRVICLAQTAVGNPAGQIARYPS